MLGQYIQGLLTSLIAIFFFLELNSLFLGTAYNQSIAAGYFTALLYTLVFGFILRKPLQVFFSNKSKRITFTLLAIIGAAVVETTIWLAQTVLGAKGAAISGNLLIDLIMTLPFYALLAFFFSEVAGNQGLSWKTVALLGGIYELFADGIVANIFQGNFLGIVISPILIPVFVVVYSPIILVPFFLVFPPSTSTVSFKPNYLKPGLAVLILPFSIGLGFILEKAL